MNRDKALEILHHHLENKNLRRHCYAVEACMRALAPRFGGDEELWGLVGLVHDVDYEKTKGTPEKHTQLAVRWLREEGASEEVVRAVLSHAYDGSGANSPENEMEWALYCCDELTGFIVAVALVRPDKSLSSVTVEAVLKKFPEKAFAAAVKREQIKECEKRLGLPLEEFTKICLGAMQSISPDLGL
jgi:putative nucleotidyltransferase with HDIG domain